MRGSCSYRFLAHTFQAVAAESGRNRIRDTYTNTLRTLVRHSPDDVVLVLYLSTNKIAPRFSRDPSELNVGGSALSAAVSEVTGASRAQLRAAYAKLGDMGDVAASFRKRQRTLVAPKPLTVAAVLGRLRDMAGVTGSGSVKKRHVRAGVCVRGCAVAADTRLLRVVRACRPS